jgi:hypothetical protein
MHATVDTVEVTGVYRHIRLAEMVDREIHHIGRVGHRRERAMQVVLSARISPAVILMGVLVSVVVIVAVPVFISVIVIVPVCVFFSVIFISVIAIILGVVVVALIIMIFVVGILHAMIAVIFIGLLAPIIPAVLVFCALIIVILV